MGQTDFIVAVGDRQFELVGFSGDCVPICHCDGIPTRADSLGAYKLERRRDFIERLAAEAAQASAAAQAEAQASRHAQASAEGAERAAAEQQALAVAEQRQAALAAARASRPTPRASSWSPSP